MKKIRSAAVVAVIMMAVAMFTACGGKDDMKNNADNTQNVTVSQANAAALLPRHMNMAAAAGMAQAPDLHIIDVRTVAEYQSGHLKYAVNLPVNDFEKQIEQLVPNKNDKVIVYCKVGGRAEQALNILQKLGYVNISNAGGVDDYDGELYK